MLGIHIIYACEATTKKINFTSGAGVYLVLVVSASDLNEI